MERRFLALALLALTTACAAAEDSVPVPAACAGLATLEPDAFSHLAQQVEAEQQQGGGPVMARLAACGVDFDALRQRQCNKAYTRQNLEFLLRYCRYEAWSLARAQCERSLDSISPRYAEFCRAFGRE